MSTTIRLANGKYRTAGGSTVEISGEHSGKARVEFDWLEEENACFDCTPEPYPDWDRLVWHCDVCGGGSAALTLIPASQEED